MKLRITAALALVCALVATPAFAAVPLPQARPDTAPNAAVPYLQAVVPVPDVPPVVVPAQTPGTSITTTAPVNSDTRISIGTFGSEVLNWALTAFTALFSGVIVTLATRFFKGMGISINETNSAKLQRITETVVHGLGAKLGRWIDGKWVIDLHSDFAKRAVELVKEQAGDTIKAMGGKVGPNIDVAIAGRVEKALADPAVPVAIAEGAAGAEVGKAQTPLTDEGMAMLEGLVRRILEENKARFA